MASYFKASPGPVMFVAGLLLSVVFLGVGWMMLYVGIDAWPAGHPVFSLFTLGIGILLILLVPFLLFLVPRGYRLTPAAVIVRCWGRKIAIPLADVCELRRIRLPYYVKTNGMNAFFGDFGQFTTYNNSLGFHDFTAYLTRNDTEVAIFRKQGEPIILSPNQPDEFIAAVQARLVHSRSLLPGAAPDSAMHEG